MIYVLIYLSGFLAGLSLSLGYVLGDKNKLYDNTAKKHFSGNAQKGGKKDNPSAVLDEEAICPEDSDYNAREELFKALKEENKIEYYTIE